MWQVMDLKPWQWEYWLESPDPELVAISRAICRLYHHPPQDGTLLCLDEKPGIQIVERKLVLPPFVGQVTRREFEYTRHGTLDLLAAFESSGLKVVGRIDAKPRHPKASDASDPLADARSREVTSLWRLAAI
jgi:hypothetical protein